MKERIVIPKDKIKVLTSCGHFPANGYFTFNKEDAKVEQVPETIGQVAFLLRQKLQENNRDWYIETHIDRHEQEFRFMGILFSSDNTLSIKINGADVVVMANISYPLMWQIIKSLIGEE